MLRPGLRRKRKCFLPFRLKIPGLYPPGEQAAAVEGIAGKVKAFSTIESAVDAALPLLEEDAALFCCGSLYLASQARPILMTQFGWKIKKQTNCINVTNFLRTSLYSGK